VITRCHHGCWRDRRVVPGCASRCRGRRAAGSVLWRSPARRSGARGRGGPHRGSPVPVWWSGCRRRGRSHLGRGAGPRCGRGPHLACVDGTEAEHLHGSAEPYRNSTVLGTVGDGRDNPLARRPWSVSNRRQTNRDGSNDTYRVYAGQPVRGRCTAQTQGGYAGIKTDGSVILITRRSQVQILPPLRREPLVVQYLPAVVSRPGSGETGHVKPVSNIRNVAGNMQSMERTEVVVAAGSSRWIW